MTFNSRSGYVFAILRCSRMDQPETTRRQADAGGFPSESGPPGKIPSIVRDHAGVPGVPDYDLLRRIGGGAYGEVWLARSILGAYRAVKVVYRTDFEDDHPFEREFDG